MSHMAIILCGYFAFDADLKSLPALMSQSSFMGVSRPHVRVRQSKKIDTGTAYTAATIRQASKCGYAMGI